MNIKVLFDRIIKVYSRVRIDVDTLEIKAQLGGVFCGMICLAMGLLICLFVHLIFRLHPW